MSLRTNPIVGSAIPLALLVLNSLLGHLLSYKTQLDDDLLWMYLTSVRIGNEATERQFSVEADSYIRSETRRDELRRFYGEKKGDRYWHEYIFRWPQREDYVLNYPLISAVRRCVNGFLKVSAPVLLATDYPGFVSLNILFGTLLTFFISMGILVWILLIVRDDSYRSAACLALAFLAIPVASYLPPAKKYMFELLDRDPKEFVLNLLLHLVSVRHAFGPCGYAAKSHFALLLVPWFLLRADGRYRVSYYFLLLLTGVHSTYATFVTGLCITSDLCIRPHIMKDKHIYWPILALFTYYASSETLLESLFHVPPVGRILIWSLVGTAGYLFLRSSSKIELQVRKFDLPRRLLDSLKGLAGPLADMALLLSLLLFTFPIAFILGKVGNPIHNTYLFGQFHSRIFILFRPILFVVSIRYIIHYLASRSAQREARSCSRIGILSAILTAFLLNVVLMSWHFKDPINGLRSSAIKIEEDMAEYQGGEIIILHEKHFYYAILKSLETGEPFLINFPK